jgi:hypothetical protein
MHIANLGLAFMLQQTDLFKASKYPAGFRYAAEFISRAEERRLIEHLQQLDFKPFEFQGFLGKRRIVSFGWRYDFNGGGLTKTDDMPDFLLPLRERAAVFAGLLPTDLQQVLLTEYQPGAPIGWHKDRSVYGDVIGVLVAVRLHVPFSPQGRRPLGAQFARAHAALGLSAARPRADRVGAQHPGRNRTALLHHVPQFS